jgi:hypothetical protein
MSKVLAFHIICCTYGSWLPNEERGSCSDFVRSEALLKFGPANPVTHGRSVAHKPFDFHLRELAREALKYSPVVFTQAQLEAVARGVGNELQQYDAAPMYAFGSLRNHFHALCGRCRYDIRRFAGRLKGAATRQLLEEGIHPMQKYQAADGTIPSPWSVKPWVVYKFTDDAVVDAIRYANDNVIRAGLPAQHHPFVVPYYPK